MSCVFLYLNSFFFYCFIPSLSKDKLSEKQGNIIVLLHGMGNDAASFDMMKQGLKKAFPADFVVSLTSVEGIQSVHLSIEQQAEVCFQELVSKIAHLGNKTILLIGYSQGGLRAYTLLKQYKHLLNIKGLITLAAPWEGVPGARVDAAMLSRYLTSDVLDDLHRLALSLGNYSKINLKDQLMLAVQFNQAVCLCPGGKDLIEGSDFLSKVKIWLQDEQIPILAIGGGQCNFNSLVPKKKKVHHFKALNKLYTFFVVGEKYLDDNSLHDMQIPLYSQHARHIVPNNKQSFKRVLIKDAFHSTYVWNVPVPKGKAMLSHPDVLRNVIQFTKLIFK